MAKEVVIEVEIMVLRTGLWCDRCVLPSRCEYGVYVLGENGPRRLGVRTVCVTTGCATA